MSPIIFVGAGIVLLGLGLGLGYWFAQIQRRREGTRICDIQNELDDYRRHVSEHFSETAQHFQVLGQQYRSLYKHMAEGAEALCDSSQSDAMLGFTTEDDPAAMTETGDEREEPPEAIKDYAPTEELESSQSEHEDAATDTAEPEAEESARSETADEPAAEEVIADKVASPASTETERTMH